MQNLQSDLGGWGSPSDACKRLTSVFIYWARRMRPIGDRLAGEDVHGYRRFVRGQVERVKRAGNDLLVDGHISLAQASSVLHTLLVEQVQRPDTDPGQRQAGQTFPTSRRRLDEVRPVEVPLPGHVDHTRRE